VQPRKQETQQETRRTLNPSKPNPGSPGTPLPAARLCKIGLRTAHLMATSVLVGGYAFGAPAARLLPWLYVAIATGVAMIFYEAYPNWSFFFEGWGLMLLAKLALLGALGFAGLPRVPILLAAVAVASIGSHMPRRWRHYSLLHRRVMR
jgi:hypothetical protein